MWLYPQRAGICSYRNQSIRGVPAAVDGALLQQAAAAAAAVANGQQPAEVGTTQLTSQLSLGGLMSGLAAAAANEAKVGT